MKQLPAPTAKSINEAHRLARSTAESAVQYAIQCGQLLAAKKEEVGHGNFMPWVEKHCDFSYASAAVYLRAAKQSSRGLEFSSLNKLLAPATKSEAAPTPKEHHKGAVSVMNPEGGRTTGAKEGTEEIGDDRPAAPIFDPPPAPKNVTSNAEMPPEADEPERPNVDEDEEDAALERAEQDYQQRIEKIIVSDDRLAESIAQLRQQSALIATLETTRDGFMRGKDTITQLLRAEQSKGARLERKLKAAEAEIEKLRERIAIMEAA